MKGFSNQEEHMPTAPPPYQWDAPMRGQASPQGLPMQGYPPQMMQPQQTAIHMMPAPHSTNISVAQQRECCCCCCTCPFWICCLIMIFLLETL